MTDNYRRGEANPASIYTDTQVAHLKALREAGWSIRAAGEEAGIKYHAARSILRGRRRKTAYPGYSPL